MSVNNLANAYAALNDYRQVVALHCKKRGAFHMGGTGVERGWNAGTRYRVPLTDYRGGTGVERHGNGPGTFRVPHYRYDSTDVSNQNAMTTNNVA